VTSPLRWFASGHCPPGPEPMAEPKKRPVLLHLPLPLLGSNQDSPDPESAGQLAGTQQLVAFTRCYGHRVSCPKAEKTGFVEG
jgi:hypothetical protein